jgi:MICOS complex subunit MIC12
MLSQRLITPPSEYDPPPPAAARIVKKPLTALIKQSWNEKVGGLYVFTRKGGGHASSWGRSVLYGGDASASKATPSQ